jgi:hypothetical protein
MHCRSSIGTAAVILGLVWVTPAFGQEAAAGVPDFSGKWTLDVYLSDSAEQIAREIRIDTGQREPEFSGEGMARGTPEGGRGVEREGESGRGRERRGGSSDRPERDSMNADDRKKLNELTEAVQFASPTLTIAQSPNDLTIAGTRGTQTIATTGKVEKQQLEAGTVDRTASWQGPSLVLNFRVGRAGTLVYTYRIAPTTKQLLIRVNFERQGGDRGPFDIKLVYNRSTQP